MPCQRSTRKKQSRRREEFTKICSWSLLHSSLRQGAFSFPCPVYCIFFWGHPVDSPIPLHRPSEILYFLHWTSMHARHVTQKVRRCIYWHTVFSLPPVWLLETRLMMVRPTRTAPEPNTNTTDAMTEIQTQVQRCQAKLICNKIAHVTNIGSVIH